MSSAPQAADSKLYDRSFLLAFLSQVLFVPANAALVHYAEWVQFLYRGDQEQALLELGYITSFGAVLGFISRPWLGQLINRLGARLIWIIGYLLFIAGFVLNLWITEISWLLYALRGIMFLGVGCIFTSSITYITLTTPEKRRTEAIGILGVGGFIGFLIGPMIGELGIITVFYLVYAGWGMTIRILLKKAPDRIGRRKILCVGLTSMVLGYCGYCTVSATSMWMILLPAFLCGTGHGLTYHCMTALSLQTFPTENRGTGTALSLMAFDFGAVVGMPIMTQLVVWQGYNTTFLTVAATVAVISIIYFRQNGIR